VWTYTIPSGKPIRSSPAIDGAKNLIFGANDGNLYIVNSSGKLVTTVALGGTLDAPAYANGNIVIGSSTGSIYSIADPAWTTNWSVSAGSAPSVPPAYDGPNGLVIVGTSNGSVIGYSSSTGSVKWTATTGGAISGLSIAGSQVFVGSADGNVYAFNERTGAQNFKIPSGDNSAVTALDANGGGPAWGTADGDMYEANAKGSVYYTKQYATTPVIGMAGAGTDEFGAYAAGDLGLLRSADGGFFYSSGSTYSVAPVVLDGILFQGDENGDMVAFTTQGYTVSPQASVRVGSVNVDIDGSTNCMP
jgi:outer membrane protein assembly factor BamB